NQRKQDEPVKYQVAEKDCYERPGVCGKQSHFRTHIIAVGAQVRDSIRLRLKRRGRPLILQSTLDLLQAFAMNPCGEPASQITAARNRREKVKLREQTLSRQPLQYTQP